MDHIQSFWFGFIVSGVFGLLSYLILASWGILDKTYKRMFVTPPKPDLKSLPEVTSKGVGTDPDQSPLEVLTQGCMTIIMQSLVHVGSLIGIGLLIWSVPQFEVSEGFFGGVVFAGVFGFLLQNIRKNLKKISNLVKLITKPPDPILNATTPPNNHVLAAKPPTPAFTVVTSSIIEIGWRLILLGILFILLYQSSLIAYSYLSDESFQVSITSTFDTRAIGY